jgi:hypothetical protein
MATVTLTINDNIAVDVRDTLAAGWGSDATTHQAKMDFIKAHIAAWLKSEYQRVKAAAAANAAYGSALDTTSTADIT